MEHVHGSYESTNRFRINPFSRQIINESEIDIVITQYDHNSERFIFTLPKIVEEHDMMLCDVVRIHYINAGSNGKANKDVYKVEDLAVSEDDPDTVTFSWLLSKKTTLLDGVLSFSIQFACTTDGVVEYGWSTFPYKSIKVPETYDNSEDIIEEDYSDILEQWKEELFAKFADGLDLSDYYDKKTVDEKLDNKADKFAGMQKISLIGISTLDREWMSYETFSEDYIGFTIGGTLTIDFQGYTSFRIKRSDGGEDRIVIDGRTIDGKEYYGFVTKNIQIVCTNGCSITVEFYGIPNAASKSMLDERIDANALKASASGEIVRVDDVSAVKHKAVAKVSSKNLVNINDMVSTFSSNNFVDNGDGSYTLTKVTEGTAIKRFSAWGKLQTPISANTIFKISCDIVESTSTEGLYIALYDANDQAIAYPSAVAFESKAFSYNVDVHSVRLYLLSSETDGSYIKIKNLQIELGNAATAYTPYVDPTTVSIASHRKNLLETRTSHSETVSGVTFAIDETGKCKINGTNTTNTWIFSYAKINDSDFYIPKGTTVTVSGINCTDSTYAIRIFTDTEVGNTIGGLQGDYYSPKTITLEEDTLIKTVLIRVGPNATVNNAVVTPQIEIGSNATDYEPYVKPVSYTPTPDGSLEIDSIAPTMTLLTDKSGVNIDIEYQQDTTKAMGDVKADITTLDNDLSEIKTTLGDLETLLGGI